MPKQIEKIVLDSLFFISLCSNPNRTKQKFYHSLIRWQLRHAINYDSSCSSSSSAAADCGGEPSPKKTKIALKDPASTTITKPTSLLPKATVLLGVKTAKSTVEEPEDDPAQHEGRVRSFRHERGNWATWVFIAVCDELLEDVQEMCQVALAEVLDLRAADNLHISLSRTVVLQYHHIDSFMKTLQAELETSGSFSICLSQLKVYANEERTRTFIAFKVDDIYVDKLRHLLRKVDAVLVDYKLPRFYEDPSFHVSFLWCLGDQVDVITANLDKLKTAIAATFTAHEVLSLFVSEINCKSGNKEFKFKLK